MGITDNAKVQAYINDVCAQIKFRAVHPEIKLELGTHIKEILEEYQEEGLSEDIAVDKAIAQMGSADIVGQQLNMIHRPKPDWSLLALSFILINMGLVAMYFMEKYNLSPPFSIFSRSLLYALIGGVILIGLYFFDYRKLAKHSLKIYGGMLLLLAWTMLFGISANGQKIYLSIGPLAINTFSISPIFFCIALAGIFKNWNWKEPKKTCQGLILSLFPFLILINGSLPIAIIYAVTCMTLMIASGARPKIFLLLAGLFSVLMVGLIISAPYRLARFLSFINPDRDPLGSGYLQNQLSKLINESGFFGLGFASLPQLPELHTDFIFSYITFTFGWIAGACLTVLVILFIFRMTRIAKLVKDDYARLLVMGFCAIFTIQFVWNILMNLGLAPISGVGLPFLSFGGSQLVLNGAALGIISSIYKRRNISSPSCLF
ncbi:MAG: FtsW/RodA/SpoVE family cell cycle protein [Desulfitobacteriaceae bacterium]|nr:FtsW/RodA/SpoVE family cell cycle protein [Desulfitobacteriaceae bacterium]